MATLDILAFPCRRIKAVEMFFLLWSAKLFSTKTIDEIEHFLVSMKYLQWQEDLKIISLLSEFSKLDTN